MLATMFNSVEYMASYLLLIDLIAIAVISAPVIHPAAIQVTKTKPLCIYSRVDIMAVVAFVCVVAL